MGSKTGHLSKIVGSSGMDDAKFIRHLDEAVFLLL